MISLMSLLFWKRILNFYGNQIISWRWYILISMIFLCTYFPFISLLEAQRVVPACVRAWFVSDFYDITTDHSFIIGSNSVRLEYKKAACRVREALKMHFWKNLDIWPSWIDKILLHHLYIVCFITFLAIYQGKFAFGKFQKKTWTSVRTPLPPYWAKCPSFSEKRIWRHP